MKIRWYGHAAFRLTTADGTNIIIDPYDSGAFGDSFSYRPISDPADIVLVSHNHNDHNGVSGIEGSYSDVRAEGSFEMRGIRIRAIPTFHDLSEGLERGQNLVFVIHSPSDDLTVVHLGDLGHPLDKDAIDRIGPVDVLMIPVGGFFTIDAVTATDVMKALGPAISIPMHFKTEKTTFPITGVEEFTKGKERVREVDGSEIEVTKEELPREPEIAVLRYAH